MRIPGTKGDHEVILKTIKILKVLEQSEGELEKKPIPECFTEKCLSDYACCSFNLPERY